MGRFFGNIEIDGLKKGPWTPEEDQKLIDYIQKYGHGCWQLLPKKARLNRCGKSCRLRWTNYLRPDIKRGNFSPQEEQTIIDLHSVMGNKWSMIANRLPGRTDNEIKNFWNTHLRKKLLRSGIDPKTHQLINNLSFINMNTLENLAKIQLLRNILQLMNTNPMLPSVLAGSELVKQFNGVHNPLQVSSVDNRFNLSSYNHQPIMENFHEISEFEYARNNGVSNTKDGSSLQNPNYEQLMWAKNCDTSEFIAVDDETNSSFWKDIFNESFFAPSE